MFGAEAAAALKLNPDEVPCCAEAPKLKPVEDPLGAAGFGLLLAPNVNTPGAGAA